MIEHLEEVEPRSHKRKKTAHVGRSFENWPTGLVTLDKVLWTTANTIRAGMSKLPPFVRLNDSC